MISVSTVVLDGHDLDQALDGLASQGVLSVEIAYISGYVTFDEDAFTPSAARNMAARLDRNGMKVSALSAHIDLGQADSADRLLRRADYAARIGAPILVSNATTASRRRQLDLTLARCLDALSAQAVVLAVENPGHGAGAIIPNGQAGASLVQHYAHPSLRLNYDICNALTYGDRPLSAQEDLRCALPWSVQLHLKDIARHGADGVFCPVGDGEVGYGDLLRWLAQQPYRPGLTLELPLRLRRPGMADPVRTLPPVALKDAMAAIAGSQAFCNRWLSAGPADAVG